MSDRNFKAVIEIGSKVGASFGTSFGVVNRSIASLGNTVRKLNAQQRKIQVFERANTDARGAQSALQTAMKAYSTSHLASDAKAIEAARVTLDKKRQTAVKLGAELTALGINTKDTSGEMERLAGSSTRAGFAMGGLMRVNAVGKSFVTAAKDVAFAGAVIGGTATAVVGSLFAVAESTFRVGDSARLTAESLGMTSQSLQELQYAAGGFNIEADQMATYLKRMVYGLQEAAYHGGPATRYIRELGLDVRFLARLKPDEAIDSIADSLSQVGDKSRQIDIVRGIFGRDAERIIPFLSQGAEGLHKLRDAVRGTMGLVLDEKNQAAVEDYGKAWNKLKGQFIGVGNTVGVRLLPVFTKLFGSIGDFITSHGPQIGAFATKLADGFERSLPSILRFGERTVNFLTDIIRIGGSMVDKIGGWGNAFDIFSGVVATKAVFSIGKFGYNVVTTGLAIGEATGLTAAFSAALTAAGVAVETTPIGWILTGVAAVVVGAAFAIRKVWGPISSFFKGVSYGVREALEPLKPVVHWLRKEFDSLIKPVQDSGRELDTWAERGVFIGKTITEGIVWPLGEAYKLFQLMSGKKMSSGAGGDWGEPAVKENYGVGGTWEPAADPDEANIFNDPEYKRHARPMSSGIQSSKPAAGAAPFTYNQPVNIHIHQQPGQSADSIARTVIKHLKDERSKAMSLTTSDLEFA